MQTIRIEMIDENLIEPSGGVIASPEDLVNSLRDRVTENELDTRCVHTGELHKTCPLDIGDDIGEDDISDIRDATLISLPLCFPGYFGQ